MEPTTNIYFDFEFIDDGRELTPISLGMCTESDKELYLEYEFEPARASDWVRANVFPHMNEPQWAGHGDTRMANARDIVEWVKDACGDNRPKFWGYYPSCDWVLLYQHWGTMLQGPKGWPIRPECLKQLADHLGAAKEGFPAQPKDAHNALADAKWNRELHKYLANEWS